MSGSSGPGGQVPYFVTFRAKRPSARSRPVHQDARFFPFAGAGSASVERVWAVLIGAGSLVAGVLVAYAYLFLVFFISFMSGPKHSDVVFAKCLGVAVALCGVALAVVTWARAGRPIGVRIGSDRLEVWYPTFKRPLVVERAQVRLATVDDGLARTERFPIEGALPDAVFKDALDNYPAGLWDDIDPERKKDAGVIWEMPSRPVGRDDGYAHDDPERPGWASNGSHASHAPDPIRARAAFLWSGAGSSLPFLRMGAGDVPNLAIVFHDPHDAPRANWWFDLVPWHRRVPFFRGGRKVRGLLLRVAGGSAAADAFEGWGVLRNVRADDVLAEGLFVAKPLAGLRLAAYALLFLAPVLIGIITRLSR